MEWLYWFMETPRQPVYFTVVAIFLGGYSLVNLIRLNRQSKIYVQGRDGEREVGGILDELRIKGYSVLHDLISKDFNIDHVIVSEHGIFVIETKTPSKPMSDKTPIKSDGTEINVPGLSPNSSAIIKAKKNAKWLSQEITKTTGKHFAVRPVIVFPGWMVDPFTNQNIWILNPKYLQYRIEKESKVIGPDDCNLIAYHLGRIVRL